MSNTRLIVMMACVALAAGCKDRYYYRTYDPMTAPVVTPVASPAIVPAGGYVEPAPVYDYYVAPGPVGDVYYDYPPDSYYWGRSYRNHHGHPPMGRPGPGPRHGMGHRPMGPGLRPGGAHGPSPARIGSGPRPVGSGPTRAVGSGPRPGISHGAMPVRGGMPPKIKTPSFAKPHPVKMPSGVRKPPAPKVPTAPRRMPPRR